MDRVQALSIPEICGLVASLLDKKDLGSCARASKQWHSFFMPFLWRHLRSHTNSYSVIAPFQHPMLFGVSTVPRITSSVATPVASATTAVSVSEANTLRPTLTCPVRQPSPLSSSGSSRPTESAQPSAPPLTVPPFSSTLVKYGCHIFSLEVQPRDLPLFVDHCPSLAQLKVAIHTDMGWDKLVLFADAHPALSSLDLQLKNRPQRSGEGVADLIANKLGCLRTLVLHTPMEIASSTLMNILAAGKCLDSLTIGSSAFIRLDELELDHTDSEEDNDMDNTMQDDTGVLVGLRHSEQQPSTFYPRSALRRLRVTGGLRCSSIVDILRCSPGLQALQLRGNIPLHMSSLCRAIRGSCRLVDTLGLEFFSALTDSCFAQLVHAFGPISRLKKLSIPFTYAGDETVLALADTQWQTLEVLDIVGGMTKISSHAIQRLLMRCTRLRYLDLSKGSSQQKQTALEAGDLGMGPWACSQLEYLSLPINGCVITRNKTVASKSAPCDDASADDNLNSPGNLNSTLDSNSCIIDYSEEVYRQLGKLHHLTTLDIGGSIPKKRTQKPLSSTAVDGNLSWTLDSGLDHLRQLSQLATLRVSGMLDKIGLEELKWMDQHWPRLSRIQCSGPIHPKTRDLVHIHLPRISHT